MMSNVINPAVAAGTGQNADAPERVLESTIRQLREQLGLTSELEARLTLVADRVLGPSPLAEPVSANDTVPHEECEIDILNGTLHTLSLTLTEIAGSIERLEGL